MQQEGAETVAMQALGWLAAHEELLPVFLGATGASLSDMRASVGDPDFLASVLDFVMMDDEWVLGFCQAAGRAPAEVGRARARLPGGEMVNWT